MKSYDDLVRTAEDAEFLVERRLYDLHVKTGQLSLKHAVGGIPWHQA